MGHKPKWFGTTVEDDRGCLNGVFVVKSGMSVVHLEDVYACAPYVDIKGRQSEINDIPTDSR